MTWRPTHFFIKVCQQGRPFSLPSQKNFSISFKPKVAIAEFIWKMERKIWYSIWGRGGGGRHASFPQKPVVKEPLDF